MNNKVFAIKRLCSSQIYGNTLYSSIDLCNEQYNRERQWGFDVIKTTMIIDYINPLIYVIKSKFENYFDCEIFYNKADAEKALYKQNIIQQEYDGFNTSGIVVGLSEYNE